MKKSKNNEEAIMYKTDLEIAQECVMEPIVDIAKKAGIGEDD